MYSNAFKSIQKSKLIIRNQTHFKRDYNYILFLNLNAFARSKKTFFRFSDLCGYCETGKVLFTL